MRTNNLNVIAATLIEHARTIPEIVQITGVSYSTVQRGLVKLGALAEKNTYPVEWKLPATGAHVITPTKGEFIDTLVSKWNDGRYRIGEGIASIEITPKSDPKALAETFEQGAATLASSAHTLREVAGKPDWFTLIGGNLDDHQVN